MSNAETTDYPIAECYVLHLNAQNDSNGNPRRIYVLGHPIAGILAAVDEGYNGTGALNHFSVSYQYSDNRECPSSRDIRSILSRRVGGTIDITPKYYRELLSKRRQDVLRSRHSIIVLDGAEKGWHA